jgi:hypothetical protein
MHYIVDEVISKKYRPRGQGKRFIDVLARDVFGETRKMTLESSYHSLDMVRVGYQFDAE